ncbi:PAS domain-containing protein [Flavobacterium sp.]
MSRILNTFKSTIFLNIAFVISLASIFFTASITYKHIVELNKSTDLVMQSYEVKLEIEKLMSSLKDAETGFRGYLLYHDQDFLQPYNNSRENLEKSYLRIKRLTKENKTQQKNLTELYRLIAIRYSYFDENRLRESKYQKYFIINSKKAMENVRNKTSEMSKLEDYLLHKREKSFKDTSFYTPFYALLIVVITLFLIVLAYIKINKDLIKLRKSNNRLLVINESQKLAEIIGKFGSWEINLNRNIYQFSDNLYRLLGYQPHDFEANLEQYLKMIHPDDLEYVKEMSKNILEQKELPAYTYRVIKKCGEVRFFQATGILIQNNFGEKVLVGTTQDITLQQEYTKKIENTNDELIENNKQLKIYEESSKQAEILGNYASWILNFETQLFSYSDNKFRLLGCEPQSFVANIENLIEFVHPDDKHILLEGYKNIMDNEKFQTLNYRVIRKDGKIRNFRKNAKMYVDSLGTKSIIGITQDITDDVNRAYTINQKNLELERSNKELIEFNYAASHDLQEPLRKIQTFISRINDREINNLSERGKEYMERIVSAATRMRILIDDLLQYSRTNKSDALFEPINLNAILEDVKMDLSEIIEENNVTIDCPTLPKIKGIPYQIQQLFANLISNSIKYRKLEESPKISITSETIKAKDENIEDDSDNLYYKISISDNGIGFEPEHAEKIFLLFNRLHGKGDYPGTGVGLAICKKIISNHNGFILADGKPNEGAQFIIYLPI